MMATLGLALLLQAAALERAATVTARVSPETPAVGEPILIELRVRAPRGTLVRFPTLPDTGTRIEPLDPRAISARDAGGDVEMTATYRLIAWDTGSVALQFSDVTLERDGRATRYPVRVGMLHIRSVLPSDSASRKPRPARDPLDADTMTWRWWVAALLLLAFGTFGWRRWKARRAAQATMDPGAAVRARQGFAHVRALDLLSAGEPGRHVLAHLRVLRRYLAERWSALPESQTAREMEATLGSLDFPVLPDRVVQAVSAAELIAYADAPVAADAAESLAVEMAGIVEDVETAWMHRQMNALQETSKIKRKRLR